MAKLHFDLDVLKNLILKLKDKNVLLIGVSYALLELSELDSFNLENWVIMETGGMKGRRKEMVRQELHQQLKKAFNVDAIHSEYGMTELLSQAYSKKNGLFETPPWMKFIIRDFEDPYSLAKINSSGGINIIDLANIYSCSFIETQDIGKEVEKDSFEILLESWDKNIIELQEEFKVLLLNRSNTVLGIYPMSKGGVSGTVVDAKLVFSVALKCNASSIIIAHNHPSGGLTPSEGDKKITEKLKKAGQYLDVTLLDHLIITKDDFYSFSDNGLLK